MTVPIYTCYPLLALVPEPSYNARPCLRILQHQQQVVQAVERAKQVTMAELNAVIGVRGLPGLPPTVRIPLLTPSTGVMPVCDVCVIGEGQQCSVTPFNQCCLVEFYRSRDPMLQKHK